MTAPALLNPGSLPQTEAIGYSQIAVSHTGRLAFVSGQVATRSDNQAIPEDLVGQVDIVIQNLSHALAALAATPHDIIQLRIYIVGLTPARVELTMGRLCGFLDGAKPSLTGIGVSGLASPDFAIEIEMVVQLPPA